MILKLDHIVIAVADLDAAFRDYTSLGFTVVRGGEHADGRTHNCLVVFADGAYLELIAFKVPNPDNRWFRVYESAGEGFLDYALLPDDTAAVVGAAQARGLDIEGPFPGGRNRPDGERLEWQTARSPGSDVPFLCGDVTPRPLRVPEGECRRHPNGVTGVASLTVAVRDLDASLARNAALLGTDTTPLVRPTEIEGAPARTATLAIAGAHVTLASPAGPDGPLATALAARGAGPFALAFDGPGSPARLDPALTHGARMAIGAA